MGRAFYVAALGNHVDVLMEVPVVRWADRAGLESEHQLLAFNVGPTTSRSGDLVLSILSVANRNCLSTGLVHKRP